MKRHFFQIPLIHYSLWHFSLMSYSLRHLYFGVFVLTFNVDTITRPFLFVLFSIVFLLLLLLMSMEKLRKLKIIFLTSDWRCIVNNNVIKNIVWVRAKDRRYETTNYINDHWNCFSFNGFPSKFSSFLEIKVKSSVILQETVTKHFMEVILIFNFDI